jgi:maltose alpha-D-glucosyltransferase/alpha-amylase
MPFLIPLEDDPLWFKDAVIYELHIKAFYDSNNDGFGDIPGLIEKLDYIQDLGINCIWLLPFYPSPLRDDGYDISDYRGIHPVYGTNEDFRRLIEEAHKRGIRIMTELVINHTSDQHPWFQAARLAPPGSLERDFYVWSDTDKKYSGTRIIFTDTESSNWTWDPAAQAYYWHRFFHHQPDLNYDNPRVLKEIVDVMRYWFDMGVDAMRLDAIPYLVEREGTNCENLPETHMVIKTLRQTLDKEYKNRVFLAEANQWPEDVRQYFGEGDECHMAYHFPLMPRIFMAVHLEDRRPITEIMSRTPAIPENCQWAMFLRNHDELTLEMVTDAERDYMYFAYSADPIMRLNVGIRRRLSPLLEHDRRCIELLNNLLLSMPGTPIIYYGDEIGMGDNVLLGDRNGVRTPMQWSGSDGAGFSEAPISAWYAPPIMDPIHGFRAVNVESQLEDRSSLLNWMKTILRVRKSYRVFGRGTIHFLHPSNRKVLAFLRKHEDATVLVVANLSRYSQSAELDLFGYQGCTPVELLGLQPFPRIEPTPYLVTLGPYSFYWFLLTPASDPSRPGYVLQKAQPATPSVPGRVPAIEVASAPGSHPLTEPVWQALEQEGFPDFLKRQPWYCGQGRPIEKVRLVDYLPLPGGGPGALALLSVSEGGQPEEHYLCPVSTAGGQEGEAVARRFPRAVIAQLHSAGSYPVIVYDGLYDDVQCMELLRRFELTVKEDSAGGCFEFSKTDNYEVLKRTGTTPFLLDRHEREGGGRSVVFGTSFRLALLRRLWQPTSADVEMTKYLSMHARFAAMPKLAGLIEYRSRSSNTIYTVGLLQQLLHNQGDGWAYTMDELRRAYERAATRWHLLPKVLINSRDVARFPELPVPQAVYEILGTYVRAAHLLGRRTAQLHLALLGEAEIPLIRPEQPGEKELVLLSGQMKDNLQRAFDWLAGRAMDLSPDTGELYGLLADRKKDLERLFDRLSRVKSSAVKIRCQDNYHLARLLCVDGDFAIWDFEEVRAEPDKHKQTVYKGLAGILRSISYATHMSLSVFAHNRSQDIQRFLPWAVSLERWIKVILLKEYASVVAGTALIPASRDELFTMLQCFLAAEACSELLEEGEHRLSLVSIPLLGLLEVLNCEPTWHHS